MKYSYWKDTEKECYWFLYEHYHENVTTGRTYNIFNSYRWPLNDYCIYPKGDVESIIKTYKTTVINPDSKLFFDSGSGFPRFKLGLTSNKRCIKTAKADYIVVSGSTTYSKDTIPYVVIEDDTRVCILSQADFDGYFGGSLTLFATKISPYEKLSNPKVVYTGILYSYNKDSMYLGKYTDGTYTLNYITDNDLDKIVNTMCPEPTYEELESVIEMLNSDDAATAQLGVKLLQGYNINDYKLSLRLILCTRATWWLYSKTTVGAKQLVSSLRIEAYQIRDSFIYGCQYAYRKGETYTAKDIAIAKKLGKKFFTEYFQNEYNEYLQKNWTWLPDERKIKLE